MKHLVIAIWMFSGSICLAAPIGGTAWRTVSEAVEVSDSLTWKMGTAPAKPRKQFGRAKRFYLSLCASNNVVSAATTNSLGLSDDASGKWNYGARIGYIFWSPRKLTFSIETGAVYRDYGFAQNNSTIPYLAIPGMVRLRLGKGFLSVNFYAGAEFNRIMNARYEYPDSSNPTEKRHNLFLHENDAVTGLYGLGIVFGKGDFQLEFFTEKISQLDTYDLQFGKTIGATALGASLQIKLF